ncbi:unnamed protein product [Leptidea sinapis]|uniref:Uncharacterized protein n=1 Tax=Leptidea sinapis TaxID=189913 RepID=A0A5E4PPG7_9NEOP|nr:unnamed protein product [Leptidea sinapis]
MGRAYHVTSRHFLIKYINYYYFFNFTGPRGGIYNIIILIQIKIYFYSKYIISLIESQKPFEKVCLRPENNWRKKLSGLILFFIKNIVIMLWAVGGSIPNLWYH